MCSVNPTCHSSPFQLPSLSLFVRWLLLPTLLCPGKGRRVPILLREGVRRCQSGPSLQLHPDARGLELQNSGPLLDTAKLHTDLRSAAVLPTLNLGFAKCYTKEKDVSGCCREAGVSEDCLVACNGSLLNGPKSSGTDFFRCMADFGSLAQTTVKAIKCFALA
uniref:Domain of unknown function DB domain-containing protein n=1 Tax=Ditylenchus dipsaci TaxID=166011 RepID=A0A915CVS7_9BILA